MEAEEESSQQGEEVYSQQGEVLSCQKQGEKESCQQQGELFQQRAWQETWLPCHQPSELKLPELELGSEQG